MTPDILSCAYFN